MPHRPTVLAVTGLGVAFPLGRRALAAVQDVSFSLAEGGSLALLGEGGSGKSIAARAVAGMVPPPGIVAAGRVQLAGRVALLAGGLNPLMRVGRQLAEAGGAAELREAAGLLEAVGLEPAVARRFPEALDAVAALRVRIAIALAGAPDLLVADEPTEGLDPDARAAVLDLLDHLHRARGMALLVATREPEIAARLCEDVVVMARGRVVELGPTASVLARPMDGATERMVAAARCLAGEGAPARPVPGASVLVAEGLGDGLLSGLGFALGAGERLGILGGAGAGKSLLAACLTGLRRAARGAVTLRGAAMTGPSPALRLLFSDPGAVFDPREQVGRSLGAGLGLLGRVGLRAEVADWYPHGFDAAGMLRLALARALGTAPAVLVADDPLAGLDPTERAEGLALLCRLQAELGFALLLLSREPGVLCHACGRILALQAGRLVAVDSAAAACQDRADEAARS